MGEPGTKATADGKTATEALVNDLHFMEVTSKKMFGGHGVFHDGTMFALVDSKGTCFFRCDDTTIAEFEALGSERHGKMPYWELPAAVRDDVNKLRSWAESAVAFTRKTKK